MGTYNCHTCNALSAFRGRICLCVFNRFVHTWLCAQCLFVHKWFCAQSRAEPPSEQGPLIPSPIPSPRRIFNLKFCYNYNNNKSNNDNIKSFNIFNLEFRNNNKTTKTITTLPRPICKKCFNILFRNNYKTAKHDIHPLSGHISNHLFSNHYNSNNENHTTSAL